MVDLHDKMVLRIIFLWIALTLHGSNAEVRVEVYEYFENVHASTLKDAEAACELRGGKLATNPDFDDWDNYLMANTMDTNVLLDTYFAVNIKKSVTGVWEYADGTPVDMTSTRALTLRELDSGQHGTYNYNCALWNPWEPFFIPSMCTDHNAFICSLHVTLYSSCTMEETDETRFSGPWPGILDYITDVTENECTSECTTVANTTDGSLTCWAAEYDSSTRRCTLLRHNEKPKTVPSTQFQSNRKTFMRNCKTVAAFEENTCSILCKCNTENIVVIPTDKEEYQEFVEEAVEKVVKELTIETSNLSATVRKKTSAKDERDSSTGMGALGITLLSLVFGGLVGMDLITLFGNIKKAAENANFLQFNKM